MKMIHVTIIPTSQKDESSQKAAGNAQTGYQVRSIQDVMNQLTCPDAANPRRQEAFAESGLEGTSPTNNLNNRDDSSSKEDKARRGYKQSVINDPLQN